MPHALPSRLRRRFIVQAVVASLVLAIAVSIGSAVMLQALIDARLRAHTEGVWASLELNPDYVPAQTGEVRIHYVPAGAAIDSVPPELRRPPGSHAVDRFDRHVRVETRPQGSVYVDMTFSYAKQVVWTAAAMFATGGMLGLLLLSWLTYRATRRLVMPVTWLAGKVQGWNVEDPDAEPLDPQRSPGDVGSEVRQLSGALRDLSTRVRALVQRERDFTRDASHELRTPLTVIRVASDMLLADPDTPERSRRSLQRIQAAGRDMEAVIDAFLILARDADVQPQGEEFRVREVIGEEVERAQPLLAGKPVELRITGDADPVISAPPRVLGVMVGNLLSNACVFTEEGLIEVEVGEDRVTVRDTGIGMSPGTLQRVFDPFYRADQFRSGGKGMGLSIVRRLGERFGWPVTLDSAAGKGTVAEIRFSR
ncbi:MAG: HAMP domain-containing histidine kinase [Gammaproteobacteria bacterium]|nr:HAMP domain-containing histidine kinase [Gammaproteobacteria bacterium]